MRKYEYHKNSRTGPYRRLYKIWTYLRYRCSNPNNTAYKHYGGRGIKVCKEWEKSFVVFRDWALLNGYSDNLSIDRIDVNGNYEPSNCRWTTQKQQGRNKRSTKLTIEDVRNIRKLYSLTETSTHKLAKEFGVSAFFIWQIIANKKWIEENSL